MPRFQNLLLNRQGPPVRDHCLEVGPLVVVKLRQSSDHGGDGEVPRSKRLFRDLERSNVKGFSIRKVPARMVQLGEPVERTGYTSVLGSESLLTDFQRSPV